MNAQMALLIAGAILLVGGIVVGVLTDDLLILNAKGVYESHPRGPRAKKINDSSINVAVIGILLLLVGVALWVSSLLHVGLWFWLFLTGGTLVVIDLYVTFKRAMLNSKYKGISRAKAIKEELKKILQDAGLAEVGLAIIVVGIVCFIVGH